MRNRGQGLKRQASPNTIARIKKLAHAGQDLQGMTTATISISMDEAMWIQKIMSGAGPTKQVMNRSEAARYLIKMGWTYLQVLENSLKNRDTTTVINGSSGN